MVLPRFPLATARGRSGASFRKINSRKPSLRLQRLVRARGQAAREVAGEVGFEPTNAGIKIRCLNQLGDSPTVEPLLGSKGMSFQAANRGPAPLAGNPRDDRARLALRPERREHARSRPAHPRVAVTLQPLERPRDLRELPAHDRLEIVAPEPREKGGNCEGFRIACQCGGTEDFPSGDSELRRDHDVPTRLEIERCEALADALGERVLPEQEERYVRTQAHGKRAQLGAREAGAP